MDQWALYVNYRSKEETKALCLRNQRIRGQQTLPHTSGAMSLARRRDLMKKMGKEVDRGKVWTETHKRKDGSYVNDQARDIGVSVIWILRCLTDLESIVSFRFSLRMLSITLESDCPYINNQLLLALVTRSSDELIETMFIFAIFSFVSAYVAFIIDIQQL
ncbi:PREDICTED: uncharacterized protein LOC109220856 [Nicotiana attenuata]|uniref:uncharacterized protein LOC109220856 n=1 Tax=Nicotiana attenuata TaxID=49451 RepID=UPI000905AB17|nr:PREDICTED: uncharacterized protein LOC109220856 [Nicotiana attenuata]